MSTAGSAEYIIIHCPFMQGECTIVPFIVDDQGNRVIASFATHGQGTQNVWNEDLVDMRREYPDTSPTITDPYDIVPYSLPTDRINGVTAWRTLDSIMELIDVSSTANHGKAVVERYQFSPYKDMSFFRLHTSLDLPADNRVRAGINLTTWLDHLTEGAAGNYERKEENLGPRLDYCTLEGKKSFKLGTCSDQSQFKDISKSYVRCQRTISDDDYLASAPGVISLGDDLLPDSDTTPQQLYPDGTAVKELITQRTEMSKYFNVFFIKGITPGFKFQLNVHQYNEYYYSDAKQRLNTYRGPVGTGRLRKRSAMGVAACSDEFQSPRFKRSRRF